MNVQIKAIRDMIEEPVFVKTAEPVSPRTVAAIAGGKACPAQAIEGGVVIIATQEKGTTEYTLVEGDVPAAVKLAQDDEKKRIDITIGDKLFTSYVYEEWLAKPYLGPMYTRDGQTYTRLDFETKEHPHHRSVFLAVGDVNGIDFWNEPADHGVEVPNGFENFEEGAAFAAFTAKNIWKSIDGVPQIDEKRRFTLYNQSEACRYLDIELTFTASYGDVVFGPTKEAGPLGIRMNEELRADKGTGTLKNCYGAVGEGECWGRSAQWCDYSGTLSGVPYGIAAFDDEKNERFPTAWHIRNYGLFAANNLYFKGGFTIKAGESLSYRFRVVFHEDNCAVADRYVLYANRER